MRNKYQILVITENPKTLTQLLSHPDYQVSFFSELTECLKQIQNQKYDLIIIDRELPPTDKLSLLSDIKKIMPALPVLIVSGCQELSHAVECIKAGASDFMEKPLKIKKLLASVENILKGSFLTTSRNEEIVKRLTKSEMRILKLILDGRSNKEIAHLLSRSERTIEDHRSDIMKKLEANNIVELVKKGISLGLTSL